MKLGFIGFGEASFNLICGFLSEQSIDAFIYDIDVGKAISGTGRLNAAEKVLVVENIAEVIKRSEAIIVAVPGKADASVFENIISSGIKGGLYIDICTALPDIKALISKKITQIGGQYVDVAVMGSIPELLHRVPMIISGTGAQEMVELFAPFDMKITSVGDVAGDASLIKLCRSIYMKGLAALSIETKRVSEAFGVSDAVFHSIEESMNADDFMTYTNRLINGTFKHCKRRKDEVEECLEIIKSANLRGFMTEGTKNLYEQIIRESN